MAGYIESNLGKDEHIIMQAEFHWSRLILPVTGVFVGLVLAIVAFCRRSYYFDPMKGVLFIVAFAFLISSLIVLLRMRNTECAFTNKNIIKKTGVLSTSMVAASLDKVNNISMAKGLFGKIFNTGRIGVGIGAVIPLSFTGLKDCEEFKNGLLEAIDHVKDEVAKKNAAAMVQAFGGVLPQTASPAQSSVSATE